MITLKEVIETINILTILASVIGGLYAGWPGALIGGVIGWLLDKKYN